MPQPQPESHESHPADTQTAARFSQSWNRLSLKTAYSREQFLDWLHPIDPTEIKGQTVAELGFGNGSLLYHMAEFGPSNLCGVELGDTHETTRQNLSHLPDGMLELHRGDLTDVSVGTFDLVYCIGVLHHLKRPADGFAAVLRHTKPGGRFHCWVYGHEGNAAVRYLVEPIRRISSKLPWWFTKYALALPLSALFFVYAKSVSKAFPRPTRPTRWTRALPLLEYSRWIAKREFNFFHHVAFDQLVSPQTIYLRKQTVQQWLTHPDVDPDSCYVVARNGNSWKFGGRTRRS